MLQISTVTFGTGGALVQRGSASVLLRNKDTVDDLYVATSQARLGAAGTRDALAPGESIQIPVPARGDEVWAAAEAGTVDAAVYITG